MGLGMGSQDGHFFGNGKMVSLWVLPIKQPHRLGVLAHIRFHRHPIPQEGIDLFIAVIQMLAGITRSLIQKMQRSRDQNVVIPLLVCEKGLEPLRFNIAVPFPVRPIA